MEQTPAPRPGARDNGLRADRYVAVADLDPRVADALLSSLREAGIAAYVAPSPGEVGGYLDVRLPTRPTDRLWVDVASSDTARSLVAAEAPQSSEPVVDEEQAWRDIVAHLEPTPFRTWSPAQEVDEDEDHYEPPPPPPVPRLHPVTAYAVVAIVLGAGVLIVPTLMGNPVTDGWVLVAVLAVLGGVGTLVYRMRDRGGDDDPDDGAVV